MQNHLEKSSEKKSECDEIDYKDKKDIFNENRYLNWRIIFEIGIKTKNCKTVEN